MAVVTRARSPGLQIKRLLMSGDTIFHKIMRKEIPATIVYEDDQALAIRDINPVSATHILIIPKKTMASLDKAETQDAQLLGHLLLLARRLAEQEGAENGFRVVINNGPDAGQAVPQLHLHLLAGRKFTWPPG